MAGGGELCQHCSSAEEGTWTVRANEGSMKPTYTGEARLMEKPHLLGCAHSIFESKVGLPDEWASAQEHDL